MSSAAHIIFKSNSDAWQTKTRNIPIKMQSFGYRTQQWIKHNCTISVEKSVFFPKPVCTNTSSSLTHLYVKPVTSQPHLSHKLCLDKLRINIMTYMKLLKTTPASPRKKSLENINAVSSLIMCQHCWWCLQLLEHPLCTQTVCGSTGQWLVAIGSPAGWPTVG